MFNMCYAKQYSASFNKVINYLVGHFLAFISEIYYILHSIFSFLLYIISEEKYYLVMIKGGAHRVRPPWIRPCCVLYYIVKK